MPRRWFDAHLDLACLAENGRDMLAAPADCGGPWQPASTTFPSLAAGGVRACLGTVFTEADGNDAVAYLAGDAGAAHAAGVRQLERYRNWAADGVIAMERAAGGAMRLRILVECADPIREPDELGWWAERGVAAIGLTWARGSRYATGNSAPSCERPVGLTDIGCGLVREMDRLGLVHDASHLSDRALADLFANTDRIVIASHSNCRALLDGRNQRHLTDDAIREIGRRGGVIGLNLCSAFLGPGLWETGRAAIGDCVRHIEHICQVMGHRRGVGLGSDMDGGFSAARLPVGIDEPRDLEKIAEALSARGWGDEAIDAFAWGNWARIFGDGE